MNPPPYTKVGLDGKPITTTRVVGLLSTWQDKIDKEEVVCEDISENEGLQLVQLVTAEEPYKLPYVPIRQPRVLGWELFNTLGCQGEPVKVLREDVTYSDTIAEFTWNTMVSLEIPEVVPEGGFSAEEINAYLAGEEYIKNIRSIKPIFGVSDNVGARYEGEVINPGVWDPDYYYREGLKTPFQSQYVYTFKLNKEIAEQIGITESRKAADLQPSFDFYYKYGENGCKRIEPEMEQLMEIALLLYPYKNDKKLAKSDLQVVGIKLFDSNECWPGTSLITLKIKDSTFDKETYERRWKVPKITKEGKLVSILGFQFVTMSNLDHIIVDS